MAETIADTHYAYPRRDGQAELAWRLLENSHVKFEVYAVLHAG